MLSIKSVQWLWRVHQSLAKDQENLLVSVNIPTCKQRMINILPNTDRITKTKRQIHTSCITSQLKATGIRIPQNNFNFDSHQKIISKYA